MNAINLPASFQNLENMSGIQHREVTNPIAFAIRNSQEDSKRVEDNLHKVIETNESEDTQVDPEKQKQQQKKKKKGQQQKNRGLENGRFIDFTA